MLAGIKNCKFYYAVQVYLDEKWQTVETFKSEGEAKRLTEKLREEAEMPINQIYKKYFLR